MPKRIGLMYPETVARLVARPMEWLSLITRPFVKLLSWCTEATLRLFGMRGDPDRSVTEEEIAASLEEGLDAGVIEAQEHQMVRNVFRLDDRQVGSMMIPRAEIVWLDATATADDVLRVIGDDEHSRYPVCRGGLDDVLGVITAQTLLQQAMQGEAVRRSTEDLQPPVFVPETLSGMELLEHFRASSAQLVFVVDEYGEVQGMITVRDVLEAITGEFTHRDRRRLVGGAARRRQLAVRRPDPDARAEGPPRLKELPEEDRGRYNTLAGMIMLLLGRLPDTTDSVEWEDWRFEVVDLDGKRVDKVLASRAAPQQRSQDDAASP